MTRLRSFSFAMLMVVGSMGWAADADAAGRSGRTARTSAAARPSKAKRPTTAGRAQVSRRLANPAKDPAHVQKVNARAKLLSKYAMEGRPAKGGMLEFDAAFAELHPAGAIRHKQTVSLSYGEGKDRSQRLAVSGVKDGIWRGHLIGTVSTHDLASLNGSAYTKAVTQRINADRVQVSYDYGPGTARTVLAKGIKSGGATAVEIAVPLNKNGMTRIIYDRTDSSGYVVGSSGAYVGRVVELNWNGQ